MPQLNKEQQRAVDHRDGPMLVLAGPGSGKTAVLVNRVLRLVREEHIDPYNILVLTFSRLAAEEMRARFISLADASYPVTFGTFHAIFYHILKRQGLYRTTEILTQKKKISLLGIASRRLKLSCCDDAEKLERLVANISLKKMGCKRLLEELSEEESRELELVYEPYMRLCRSEGYIDFDDMISECLKTLKGNDKILKRWQDRYCYILVDEFQDIDLRQYEVLRLLAGERRNVFCVGDDDQSIYSFRGAEPAVMRQFARDYPDAVRVDLRINYRCPEEVVRHAGKLIAFNKDRFKKEQVCLKKAESVNDLNQSVLYSKHRHAGHFESCNQMPCTIEYKCFRTPSEETAYCMDILNGIIHESGRNEIDNNSMFDNKNGNNSISDEGTNIRLNISTTVGILYRTSKSADLLEEVLRKHQIPYRRKDRSESFYTKDWVKDVAAYLKLACQKDGKNLDDNKEELIRILNRPERGLTRESITVSPLTKESVLDYYMDDLRSLKVCWKLFDDINFISGMNCYGALNYILKGIGLGRYIKERYFTGKSCDDVDEAVNELKERARGYSTIRSWVEAIESECNMGCGNDSGLTLITGQDESCKKVNNANKGNSINDRQGLIEIELMTIHGSKGLEFDNVIMIGLQEGIFPGKRCETAAQIEEERRLFYVAMTRCRKRLWMIGIRRDEYGKRESRFISEAGFTSETVGSML